MTRGQRTVFWIVVSLAVAVCISGVGYTFLAVYGPLHVTMFGRPYPAWMLGFMVTIWGGYTVYRLYRLFNRTSGLEII
jgi:hypothetical protein